MNLDVLICTLGPEGLLRTASMTLPQVDGVTYIVSCQNPAGTAIDVPAGLKSRNDVQVHFTPTRGLSVNRNHALSLATADICLIADDDLDYTAHGLQAVIEAFERFPDMDIATFRYGGGPGKRYPAQACRLGSKLPRGYYVSSIEMAIRRGGAAASLRFDERFGLGSQYFHGGEEELFLWHARRSGMHCRFIDCEIVMHHGPTSGTAQRGDVGVLMAFGAVIRIMYPVSCVWRLPLKAWRERHGGGFVHALRHIMRGARRANSGLPPAAP